MALFYLEASAFVKRYIDEDGTESIDSLFDEHVEGEFLVTSLFSILEVRATFGRLAQGGRIAESQLSGLLSQLWSDAREMSQVLELDNALVEEALRITARYHLRAGDTIHLASILRLYEFAGNTGQALVVVSSDRELIDACESEGLRFLDPASVGAGSRLQELRQPGL